MTRHDSHRTTANGTAMITTVNTIPVTAEAALPDNKAAWRNP